MSEKMTEIVNGLENIRRCFRSGMFGQREVWERQLEDAIAALAAANAEIAKLREALQAIDNLWSEHLVLEQEAGYRSPVGIAWAKARDALSAGKGEP